MKPSTVVAVPAGQSLKDWLLEAGISKPTESRLPAELRPACVRIGRRRLITERAADWLVRVREAGGVSTKRAA